MERRNFLKAAGCTLALPALETLGAEKIFASGAKPKRMFILTSGYGVHLPHFYPDKGGKGFVLKECAKALEPHRSELTILGNLKNGPNALSGHHNQHKILYGSDQSPLFGDSLDQFAAKQLGKQVPFEYLAMKADFRGGRTTSMRNRVPVSQLYDPAEVYNQFFGKKDAAKRTAAIARDRSVLDLCRDQAKTLQKQLSRSDTVRLDDYFNSIRETERFLHKNAEFISKPAPDTGYTIEDFEHKYESGMFPRDFDAYYDSLLKCVDLAFKFDLTRVATLSLTYVGSGHHGATHHGNRDSSMKALFNFDTRLLNGFAAALTRFKNTKMPEGGTLMDQTVSLYAAGLGSAAAHSGNDLPAIVAGGGFKHGQYLRFEQPQDISDLYLTLLRQVGIETDSFLTGSKTLEL